jgi:predicted peptidase
VRVRIPGSRNAAARERAHVDKQESVYAASLVRSGDTSAIISTAMHRSRAHLLLFLACVAVTASCRREAGSQVPDRPRLTSNVSLQDVTFRSTALGRNIQYRVISPVQSPGQRLPVVFMLHGAGGATVTGRTTPMSQGMRSPDCSWSCQKASPLITQMP